MKSKYYKNYQEYLKSDYWQNIRFKIYERDENRCRICNSDEDLCVHHRTYDNLGHEILDDLITLCKHCHYLFHKNNYNISYSAYIRKIEYFEEQKSIKAEMIRIKEYLHNNISILDKISDTVNKYNYIKYGEISYLAKKILKKSKMDFKIGIFVISCIEVLDLVGINSWGNDMREKYNFPINNVDILIDRDIFNLEKDFIEVRYILTNMNI